MKCGLTIDPSVGLHEKDESSTENPSRLAKRDSSELSFKSTLGAAALISECCLKAVERKSREVFSIHLFRGKNKFFAIKLTFTPAFWG